MHLSVPVSLLVGVATGIAGGDRDDSATTKRSVAKGVLLRAESNPDDANRTPQSDYRPMDTGESDLGALTRKVMSEKDIGPGEDWSPVLVVRNDGKIEVIEFPGELAASHMGKAMLTRMAADIVTTVKANEAVLGLSAWMVRGGDESEFSAEHPVSADPRRVEALIVCCWLESGDSTWLAEVSRDADERPSVGEWERLSGMIESRFDPIGEALERWHS